MQKLDENLWLLSYPLKTAGFDLQRHVAVVRLAAGDLVLLSTGPFSPEEVAEIRSLGRPRWLVDGMLRHDTFSKEGRSAFPEAVFLAPPGFEDRVDFPVSPILPPPAEWDQELQALELDGIPASRETVFFHPASRTLIVQDLAFNFPGDHPLLSEVLLRLAVGKHHAPGIARSIKLQLRDRPAFERALGRMLAWDFDRVIVGHGERLETGGKAALREALLEAGFEPQA